MDPSTDFCFPVETAAHALEASDDGQNYRVVVALPKGRSIEHTISSAQVTARFFRVTFKTLPWPRNPFGDLDSPGINHLAGRPNLQGNKLSLLFNLKIITVLGS
jgi:hypothetical protein